jgi:hypothetical protein
VIPLPLGRAPVARLKTSDTLSQPSGIGTGILVSTLVTAFLAKAFMTKIRSTPTIPHFELSALFAEYHVKGCM